ncbi:MAG: hypothetical protein LBU65_06095 [Planctomycetaceae bacterium]|jgi:hypothetical protein|nr:hypothetical protein [Planctomycetaceae bacterium]
MLNDDDYDEVSPEKSGITDAEWKILVAGAGAVIIGIGILAAMFSGQLAPSWQMCVILLFCLLTVIFWRIRLYGQAINCALITVALCIVFYTISKFLYTTGLHRVIHW